MNSRPVPFNVSTEREHCKLAEPDSQGPFPTTATRALAGLSLRPACEIEATDGPNTDADQDNLTRAGR